MDEGGLNDFRYYEKVSVIGMVYGRVGKALEAGKRGRMKSYQWYKKQKKRVRKKYTLLLRRYLSPKELREWYKHWTGRK